MANPAGQGTALFEMVAVKEKKLPGEADTGHYAMYSGPNFDDIISQQIGWYRRWL